MQADKKRCWGLLIGLAGLCWVGSAQAAPIILDFTDATCAGGGSCGNGSQVDQSYGDVTNELDVIWDRNRSTLASENVYYWEAGYEDLPSVAYGTNGGGGLSITFQALSGFEVWLGGFDIAPYLNRERDSQVRVLADGSSLLDTGIFEVDTADVTNYAFTETWAQSVVVELGPDAWDIGISNIRYQTRVAQSQPDNTPVPLPATLTLMALGLLTLGFTRRRAQS